MALTHALLSALVSAPATGYDLARRFDGSVGFFWRATHQQIYRELNAMEDEGLVKAEAIEQEGRPDKKVYAVTKDGRRALQKWMETPAAPSTYKEEILVKLFAGPLVSSKVMIEEVERHREVHRARLDEYEHIRKTIFPHPKKMPPAQRWQFLTLRCGLLMEQQWLVWCDEAIDSLRRDQ